MLEINIIICFSGRAAAKLVAAREGQPNQGESRKTKPNQGKSRKNGVKQTQLRSASVSDPYYVPYTMEQCGANDTV